MPDDQPTSRQTHDAHPSRGRAGLATVVVCAMLLVTGRAADLWIAQQYGRDLSYAPLVSAIYFAARLIARSPSARWITILVAALFAWLDWSRMTSSTTPDAVLYVQLLASALVIALLAAGPGVSHWFRAR